MSFRKYIYYFKFFLKSTLLHPIQSIKELSSDISKDKKGHQFSSQNYFVWCAGLPKSGTTLIEEIFEILPYVNMSNSLKRIYYPGKLDHDHGVSEIMMSGVPDNKYTFLKTHTHFSEKYEKIVTQKNAKIIISVRDLRDMMISRYYHILADKTHWFHESIKDLSFEDGFIKSINKKKRNEKENSVIEYYYFWIENWLKIANQKKYLVLWYEDYIDNPINYVQKILNYINFDEFSAEDILEKIKVKKSSIFNKSLFKYGRKKSTFRVGKKDQWREKFNDRIEESFNVALPKNLKYILKS